jgi:hypothetical protein
VQLRNAGSTEAIIANVQTNLDGAPRLAIGRNGCKGSRWDLSASAPAAGRQAFGS